MIWLGANKVITVLFINTVSVEKELNNEGDVMIYPNPTTGIVNIDVEDFIAARVFSIEGKLMMTVSEVSFSIESLNQGIYFVVVQSENGMIKAKLIKE